MCVLIGRAAGHLTGVGPAAELIASLGGGLVKGYPEDASSVAAGFLCNGELSTYERPGFTRERLIRRHQWVVSKTIAPSSSSLRRCCPTGPLGLAQVVRRTPGGTRNRAPVRSGPVTLRACLLADGLLAARSGGRATA